MIHRSAKILVATLPAFVVFFITVDASYAQKKWDGGGNSTSWYDAANWSPDGVPGMNDSVTFDNSLKTTSYSVMLPTGQSIIILKRLRIRPDSGKTITVTLPSGNIAPVGLSVGDD